MQKPKRKAFTSNNQGVQRGDKNTQHNHFYAAPPKPHQERPEPQPLERVWNVPYFPNEFFTGREEFLKKLARSLENTRRQAISGTGGIGKTQTAVAYAYQQRERYVAVLWVRASTTIDIDNSYREIATLLNLSGKEQQDPEIIRDAVKVWLSMEKDYLLILDNADEPRIVSVYLPSHPLGHILVTSRQHSLSHIKILNALRTTSC